MELIQIVIITLAAYRLSRMIVIEEGPGQVFIRLRSRFSLDSWLGRGVNCLACVSFWISGIVALLMGAAWYVWLAGAAGVVLIGKATKEID